MDSNPLYLDGDQAFTIIISFGQDLLRFLLFGSGLFLFDNVDPDQNIVDLNPQDWVQLGRI